ncbi:calcium-responsive transcription factor [Salvelinus sp. IW2-2015]|uniref:calcium-responsive transcription factor n=1 Tax=Salvelinus sp. IW2-2015 TaxID=2691554 RepID=UPI0038D43A89
MEEQERAKEEDALDSKPPLTTEEDEPKHTDLHWSHITETQQYCIVFQEPSEPEENETKPQSSELLVINSLAPLDSWAPVHTEIKPEELTKTEMLILSQTENQAAIQTQTLSQTDEFIILDQNGQPLQCERMVLVTSQSDNGEMYVIPSNQLGGAQVLLPRGHLLDIIDPTGSCGEEELHSITLTAVTDDSGGLTTVTSAVTDDSGGLTTVTSAVTIIGCYGWNSGSLTTVKRLLRMTSGGLTTVTSLLRMTAASHRLLRMTAAVLTTVTSAAAKTSTQSSQDCFTSLLKPLPSNAPNWALRLHNAESYSDGIICFLHLYPGSIVIYFLHLYPGSIVICFLHLYPGSRAIVMECQYGPRRKGLQPKKTAEQNISQSIDYKATCPARIYIKKVCKFPQHRVPTDPNVDKRVVRQEQEKAFFNLRKTLWDVGGVLRYYMQLPTQKAHLYHDMEALLPPPPPDLLFLPMEEEVKQEEEEEERGCVCDGDAEDGGTIPSRLHPRVAEKIRELVEQGYHQVYQVRKQLSLMFHLQWTEVDPMTETVTLTLTPAPAEGAFQRVGVLEGTDTLSPEAVQLFSSLTSLQPKIFAQLQGIQVQPDLCSFDGGLSQSSTVTTDFLDLPSPSPPQPLLVSPTQFLQSSPSLGEAMTLADTSVVLSVGQVVMLSSLGDGQVVSVSSLGDESVGTHHILLEDGQTIPFQIVAPANIALNSPDEVKEEDTVNPVD